MAGGATGFWSYVHDDDEDGRIADLARWIRTAYAMVTGEPLELFLDRTTLEWGNAWEKRIEDAIAGTTFFIPIVTPRYFQSESCREELIRFSSKASGELQELLLPVYYVRVPELDEAEPDDELMRLVKTRQWEDWRELRLEDPDGSHVRKGVHKMASALAEISARVALVPEKIPPSAEERAEEPPGEDERPGVMDLLAQGEDAMPRITEAIESMGSEIDTIGTLTEAATQELAAVDAQGGSFATRLRVVRDLAGALDVHAERIEALGLEYASALLDADPAIQTFLDGIEEAIAGGEYDPDAAREAQEFLASIQYLAGATDEGLNGLRVFLRIMDEMSAFSRDMRRPATRIKKGLQGMVDGHAVIGEWGRSARDLKDRFGADGTGDSPAA